MQLIITVFTPTYNRAYTLGRCYESLKRQTNQNFVWLIVDDGSTDNTKELAESWQKENKIAIKYHSQENGGKHIAHNTGVKLTETELFVCVDSDDYLTDDAIELCTRHWQEVNAANLAGIVALKGYSNDKPTGTLMPSGVTQSTIYDLYNSHGFTGDAMLVFKTKVLKKHLFPVIAGEKFFPEAYIYDRIDQEYQMSLLDKVLYICEYLEDGYSSNYQRVFKNNPKAYAAYHAQRLNLASHLRVRYKSAILYSVASMLSGNKRFISEAPRKVLTVLSLPLALVVLFLRYGIKKEKSSRTTNK